MSLLAWLGESWAPSGRGALLLERADLVRRQRGAVLARGLVALLLLGGWIVFALGETEPPWAMLALTLGYLVRSTLGRSKPDTSDVGWFGELLEHPFRWSGYWKLILRLAHVARAPGRFVVGSIAGLAALGWDAWHASDEEWRRTGSAEPTPRPDESRR